MCSILIVDDEERVRSGLSKYLSNVGSPFFVAGTATDGVEALQMVDRLQPDVIITDINMPHMDGLEFVEQLRLANEDAQVIILSGYDDFLYAQRAMRAGACEYLLKPVDRKYLLNLLETLWKKTLKNRCLQATAEAPNPITDKTQESLADKALELLLQHWDDPALTLDQIAKQLYLNTNYLRQLFKRKTGVSFVKYIRDYRMRQAQLLLSSTELQVRQVAQRVGYEDTHYFTNCFRDWCHQSPSEYKEACADSIRRT